jgi:NAD(P)-dependent dehydrogenase (short-subunit alcohol dehydrogenase family)
MTRSRTSDTSNNHIVVVGGTSGIGLAIAKAAHAQGSVVTILGRGAERAADIARSIGPAVEGRHIDLDDGASIRAALSEGAPIDHLVFTAIHRVNTGIRTLDIEGVAKLARVKLVGYLEAIHAALPRIRSSGSLVLFSGLAKANPYPGSTMVSVVNGGIVGMTKTLAVELSPVRVNCISPGLVPDSPAWRNAIAAGAGGVVDAMTARTPAKRLAGTDDVVHATFFLMENRAVNGIDLEIDGGIQLV